MQEIRGIETPVSDGMIGAVDVEIASNELSASCENSSQDNMADIIGSQHSTLLIEGMAMTATQVLEKKSPVCSDENITVHKVDTQGSTTAIKALVGKHSFAHVRKYYRTEKDDVRRKQDVINI